MSKLFRQFVDTIRPYLAFVKALFQTAPWLTVALGALFVLRSLAPVGFVVGAATVVARVPTAVQTGLDSPAGGELQLGFVVMVVAFLVQQITPALQQSTGYDLGNRYNIALEQRLMRATISPAGIGHLEDPQLHNEILAATRGLTGWQRPADGPNALAARLSAKVSFIGASALLVFFHWWVALPVLISGLWMQAQIVRSLSAQVEAQRGMAAAQRRSFYFRELALTPPAAKEIRVFGIVGWLVDRYRESFTTALRLIYERFLDLTSGLTTLLISHRFSTVRRAEGICVLEEGRVVEEGDHDSLMISGGRYAELFRLQAQRFLEESADESSERSEVTP